MEVSFAMRASAASGEATAQARAKYMAALQRVEEVLSSAAAAEELASCHRQLAPLARRLVSEKPVAVPGERRGVPLQIAVGGGLTQVKVLKSAWHADGTWPLIGYDEAEKHTHCDPGRCVLRTMQVSRHRHVDIVRNPVYEEGVRSRTILPCRTPHATWFEEPSMDSIAASYRDRAQAEPIPK